MGSGKVAPAPLISCFCAVTLAPSAITHAPAAASRHPRKLKVFMFMSLSCRPDLQVRRELERNQPMQDVALLGREQWGREKLPTLAHALVVEEQRGRRIAARMREPVGEAHNLPLTMKLSVHAERGGRDLLVVVHAEQHLPA